MLISKAYSPVSQSVGLDAVLLHQHKQFHSQQRPGVLAAQLHHQPVAYLVAGQSLVHGAHQQLVRLLQDGLLLADVQRKHAGQDHKVEGVAGAAQAPRPQLGRAQALPGIRS